MGMGYFINLHSYLNDIRWLYGDSKQLYDNPRLGMLVKMNPGIKSWLFEKY